MFLAVQASIILGRLLAVEIVQVPAVPVSLVGVARLRRHLVALAQL